MHRKFTWTQLTFLSLVLAASIWFMNTSFAGNEDLYFKTDKGLFYLKQVYETISRKYVDEVDPEGLSKSAIKGIVDELDPYTVFIEKQGSEAIDMITKGKYGGLGMEISKRDGKVTIIAPIDNTPAQRAGIQAGDVITKVDGVDTKDLSLDKTSSRLRGKIGTQVTIEIHRPGMDEPIELTLMREEIVIKDVTYADFIEPGTAFFRLTGFSSKAGEELRTAILDLQRQAPIERVVLDLRGNPGGLLTAAVEVANVFVKKGEMVVKTKGNHEREEDFKTPDDPLLPTQPLVVLVDGGSASASEIVAGAIQDLDRGVIVGSETFGKGLVQQVYPVDKINDAFLKITTAKYYVPSGRCIQKEDYKKDKSVFLDLGDSTEFKDPKKYSTKNGRPVYGNGGIKPDIEIENPEYDDFLIGLWAKGYFFNFTVNYLSEHPELKVLDFFNVNENVLNEFSAYLKTNKLDVQISGESELKDFLEIANEKHYSESMVELVKQAQLKLEEEKANEFERNGQEIKNMLNVEFADRLHGSTARIAARLSSDKVLDKAKTVLKNLQEYNELLAIK